MTATLADVRRAGRGYSRRWSDPRAASVYRAAEIVASRNGLDVAQVLWPQGWEQRRARHLAVYLACCCLGVPLKPIARSLGCTAQPLRQGMARIEDDREDPQFDEMVTGLEEALTCPN